jgi:hypothetical protein
LPDTIATLSLAVLSPPRPRVAIGLAAVVLALGNAACGELPDPRAPDAVDRATLSGGSEGGPAARAWTNEASIDGPSCRAELVRQGVRFRNLPDRDAPDERGCGMPHGVVVEEGPSGVVYSPPLMVDCSFALELGRFERIVQDEALRHLRAPIGKITTMGSFSCREKRSHGLSEHAFGDAMDVGGFQPRALAPPKKSPPTITVLHDYPLGSDTGVGGHFLHAVLARLRAEPAFGVVLGPEDNADHRNHFHVDRQYRTRAAWLSTR